MRLRWLAGLAATCAGALMPASVHADPPGPTDYSTRVVSIEPATDAIEIEIVGGDSFVMMTVDAGSEVEVVGYHGEPYLRFRSSGDVLENRTSPTFYASLTRYGSEIPDGIDAETEPRWERVGTASTYAWHDHRTHWMNEFRPPGRQAGDVILEASVPLLVDGQPTLVTVESSWQAAPSKLPVGAGALAGVAVVAGAMAWRRSVAAIAVAIASVAAVALTISAWAHRSVPAETQPSPLPIALSAVAAIAGVVALIPHLRWTMFSMGALTLAATELVLWGWIRRGHLTAAILPTDAPHWFDRAVTSMTFTAAVVSLAGAVCWLVARPALSARALAASIDTGLRPSLNETVAD